MDMSACRSYDSAGPSGAQRQPCREYCYGTSNEGGDPTQNTDATLLPRRVAISWARILSNLGVDATTITVPSGKPPITVLIDESDVHYHILLECIRHLQHQYPQELLCPTTPDDFSALRLADLPACFSTLVNLVLDVSMAVGPPMDHSQRAASATTHVCMHAAAASSETLRSFCFALCAADSLRVAGRTRNTLCALLGSQGVYTKADVYKALLLDAVASFWRQEYTARANLVVRSPMPWSRVSIEELSAEDTTSCGMAFEAPIVALQNLPDEHSTQLNDGSHAFGALLDIPWLGAQHDGYPFCTTLSGYTEVRRRALSKGAHSFLDDAALWTSAMTFGLLEAVMRMRIPESILVVSGQHTDSGPDSGAILSGARIMQLITYWATLERADGDLSLDYGRDAMRLLRRALDALDEEHGNIEPNPRSTLSRCGMSKGMREELICTIGLSVVVPLCLMVMMIDEQWKTLPEYHYVGIFVNGQSHGWVKYTIVKGCERRMRALGWCPYVTAPFYRSRWVLMMLSILVHLQPYIKSSPEEHAHCTEDKCVLYSLTETDTYVPRHVLASCACEYVKPPLDEVFRLLSEGQIPVVTFDGYALRVLPANGNPYVAISHVWAEGMGSTTEDGLPSCVVKRIAGLAQRLLPETGAFWMDSLCVPNVASLRHRAIKLMAETYRRAAKVLVIDDHVRTHCAENKPWTENLLRIASSAWLRRVWTLQEGLLARELYFEFSDGPVDVESRIVEPQSAVLETRNGVSLSGPILRPIHFVHILAFRGGRRLPGAAPDIPIAEIVGLLSARTTTKPEDELIAIASLLPPHVKLDALLAEPDGPDLADRRMRAFLLQMYNVPALLPFGDTPRLALPGFTWAPRRLVREHDGVWRQVNESAVGTCTADGLVAQYFLAPSPVGSMQSPAARTVSVPSGSDICPRVLMVQHEPSRTAYILCSQTLDVPLDTPAVGALLFASADFSQNEPGVEVPCVAVSFLPDPPDGNDLQSDASIPASKDRPRAFKYVARWLLARHVPQVERAILENGEPTERWGELQKTWVRLT
ncbi:hypothetical protein GY45DRAFT_456143 [Cubamyces sp. BRFM 1775]|nr:hypothetical protein GY45DRAFT_456143 [Cubamyces sp. BRFM 1775]